MLIQVYIKNEPLVKCDVLIARDDAVMSVPAAQLKSLQESEMDVRLVRPFENMGMKAAVFVADAIKNAGSVSSPVFISCPDKSIMDGICSMEYVDPAGGPIKCIASGTKPQSPPRVRNRAKQPAPKPVPAGDKKAGAKDGAKPGQEAGAAPAPGTGPVPGDGAPAGGKPADDDLGRLMQDPDLTKNGEVVLAGAADAPADGPRDPVKENTPKIMGILKDAGIPSGQIPGVLEALREAVDAQITLPMQVRLKLAKDGATGDMDPDETSGRVAPKFDELKSMLNEIDTANSAKS